MSCLNINHEMAQFGNVTWS